ncbi:hypothetical protein PHMEG_0003459 [Phytophthora megakarya]|uniref:Uncharacterized protein n=1 Tax=Phytophthora megakarya TaxID=4795 RepID=A0A225WXZ8_9STRA|nr:hypothetical protein PHMEG_0003459 [Phytophthora megakarya]
MMEWLQRVDSPEYILRTLNATIIIDWTRRSRVDCLLLGMEEIQEKIKKQMTDGTDMDKGACNSLISWSDFIRDQKDTMQDDGYIHSPDLWRAFNKFNPEKIKQLCRKGKADRLSRQILAAFTYSEEFLRLLEKNGTPNSTTREVLNVFIETLQKYSGVQQAYYGSGSDGDWVALESMLALHQGSVGLEGMGD